MDKAGNTSAGTLLSYTLDTTAPLASGISGALQAGNLGDTGINSGDNLLCPSRRGHGRRLEWATLLLGNAAQRTVECLRHLLLATGCATPERILSLQDAF